MALASHQPSRTSPRVFRPRNFPPELSPATSRRNDEEFSTMPKVIVLDTLAQEGLSLLAAAKGIEYEVRTGLKGDALRAALSEADGAICRSGVKIMADVLEGNHRLKAIVRAG